MRFLPLIPLTFTFVALILSLLCIFAGSKTGYLEDASLLTVNTSMLGQGTFNTSRTSSKFLQSIQKDIQSDLNKVAHDLAKALQVHDFYSAHLLDYCEGYYTPSPIANLTSTPSKNVTHCSNHTAFFHFDPAAVLQSELKPGVNLTTLKWPKAVQDAINGAKVASKVMFLLYCIGVAAVGLALIGACINVFLTGRLSALVNFMMTMLAWFALLIASAVATGIANKVVSVINTHGSDIGVVADKGTRFMGITWAADILMFLSSLMWLFEFIKGRRDRLTYVLDDGQERKL